MQKMANLKDGLFEGSEFVRQRFVNPDGLPKAAQDPQIALFNGVNDYVDEPEQSVSTAKDRGTPEAVNRFSHALK